MWARRLSVLIGLGILVAGFGINKALSARKEDSPRKTLQTSPVMVSVQSVSNRPVQAEVPLTGRLRAANKIDVLAEVSGRLLPGPKPFQEGMTFRRAEPLLRMDNTDQRLALVAQRSAFQSLIIRLLPDLKLDYPAILSPWEAYLREFDPEKELNPLPEVTDLKARNFLSLNNVYNQYYAIISAEAQLRKYTVYAPFDGVLVQGDLDAGNVVRAGTVVGQFLQPNRYELEASIAQPDLAYVQVGQSVELYAEGSNQQYSGTVDRIAQSVDPGTQTVRVYIQVQGDALREGIYLSGVVKGREVAHAIPVERELIRDDQTLWVVRDSTLQTRQIEVLYSFGEQQVVRGLDDGDLLVTQRIPGGYAGMPVRFQP